MNKINEWKEQWNNGDMKFVSELFELVERYEKALKYYADDDEWHTYDGASIMENGGSWEAKSALGVEELYKEE